jgi:hypothetical protein
MSESRNEKPGLIQPGFINYSFGLLPGDNELPYDFLLTCFDN